MADIEIRSPDKARRFLLQGLCMQRASAPSVTTTRAVLEWALELAAEGHALPPLGFVGDLGGIAQGFDRSAGSNSHGLAPALPPALVRSYEDHVLGKLYADRSFERASDALRRYTGRDRARGIAYVIHQFQQRAGFAGVHISPATVKALLELPASDILARGWESLEIDGLDQQLITLYEDLVSATRLIADILGPEDIFELEHGTALAVLGERVALRQVVQAAARFEAALPATAPQSPVGRREAPTRAFDEDAYPVGGFASISNRGSIESLLHSQLAFMETEGARRPDLFDIKFLRDELLYYARDENEFRRRRRSFAFAFLPDLARARFKDPELPFQRLVLAQAFTGAAIHKLADWLDSAALTFEIFVPPGGQHSPLAEEERVLRILFREKIESGAARIRTVAGPVEIVKRVQELSRRSEVRVLVIGVNPPELTAKEVDFDIMRITAARPDWSGVSVGDEFEPEEPFDSWSLTLERLLAHWA